MIDIRAAVRGDAALIQQMLVAMAHDLGQASDYRGSADAIMKYGFGDEPPSMCSSPSTATHPSA
ncbi:hypothetical protein [Kordiimonas gwangyangensis]|uniref:hypothetical protein n=1 Tax=Kordiimonas gwangyangensis TaxID=288022 RepID=UPI00068543EB|nr:hypothetical protein [Kordiimonas gwangyangensis]